MRDAAIWQAAHRIAGKLMIQFAVVLAVLTFLLPTGPWLVTALLICVLIPLLAASVISYRLSRHPELLKKSP